VHCCKKNEGKLEEEKKLEEESGLKLGTCGFERVNNGGRGIHVSQSSVSTVVKEGEGIDERIEAAAACDA
jgi:hypothetical protein